MTSYFNAPHLHHEQSAIDYVEARVWADGRVCPHCGVIGNSNKLGGKSTRLGVWKCYDCRKPFTVKIGTLFENSPIKMHLWLQAIFLMASSKKGVSSNQLHRILGVTLKTAWFMGHRIRLAMSTQPTPFMGSGGMVGKADETYIGRKEGKRKRAGHGHKHTVFVLVERGGKVRSVHFDKKGGLVKEIREAMFESVSDDAKVMTDDGRWYRNVMGRFASHESVNWLTTLPANTSGETSTPTPSKECFRCSSAV